MVMSGVDISAISIDLDNHCYSNKRTINLHLVKIQMHLRSQNARTNTKGLGELYPLKLPGLFLGHGDSDLLLSSGA